MTIAALCFSDTVGGLELANLRRTSELARHGHRGVAILARGASELAKRAVDMGLEVERIRVRLPYTDIIAGRRIRRLIDHYGIDLLLVARTKDLSTAMLGARSDTAVVLYHQMQSGIDKRDWLHNRIYRRLDACIVITDRQRGQLLRTTALDATKIHLVPYGVDLHRYSPESMHHQQARANFAIPDDAFVVGIVGGFSEGKGQRDLLAALRLVFDREPLLRPRLWGLFVGERAGDIGEYTTSLRRMRRSLPFADRIVFSPFIDNPVAAYRSIDLFVLASHSETFGMVVQEAMASGCAVIATDAGGVPEIVTDGVDGLLVPPRSPEDIAEAVLRLWHDPALRARLAANARSSVATRYDPDDAYRRFVAVLTGALEQRRTR